MQDRTHREEGMRKRNKIRAGILSVLILMNIAAGYFALRPVTNMPVFPVQAERVSPAPISIPNIPTVIPEPEETVAPEPDDPHPANSSQHQDAAPFGVLTIRKQKINVSDNVEESTLEKSPGWMPDSALPGEGGMSVILGHRNRRHFRALENVNIGDSILFTYANGCEVAYTVAEICVYENSTDWWFPTLDGNTLVMVTCWPFRYSGSAPGKYVVVCNVSE